ncbi:MAG TPA: hypothetical protein VGD40_11140, partial [Chryseosolibacter sp.]
MKFYRLVIGIQSGYMLITAVWPIVHIESFMDVTGPKNDIWLVKTVGALLIPMAFALFLQMFTKRNVTALILGGGSAIAFSAIDFYYALNDVISDIYLAD